MIRAIGFVVISVAIGLGSGMYDRAGAIRGAILGGTLAVGMLACEGHHRKKGSLSAVMVLAVAVAVSLSAFLLICDLGGLFPGLAGTRVFWHRFFTCLLISSGLLFCYRSYALRQRWWLKLFCFLVIPLMSVLLRTAVSFEGQALREGETVWPRLLSSLAHYSRLGLFPFLLPWGVAAWMFGFFRTKPGNAGDRVAAEKEEA